MSPCARGVRKVSAAQTSGQANLVLACQTGFFECEHPFIDKLMVIIEPAVAGTRLLDLGSKLYPSNMPRVLNIDLTRFIQSLSRVRLSTPNSSSERKAAHVCSIDTLLSAFAKYYT